MMKPFAALTMFQLLVPILLSPSSLTASEVFQRIQKAYDSVKTFEQDAVGGLGEMKGTAHISFSRPGRLRVSGKVMFAGSGNYDFVSTPQGNWVLSVGGNWSQVKDVESGIASITGISANAGTLVPATLTHSAWGSLRGMVIDPTLSMQFLGGRKVLCLKGKANAVSTPKMGGKRSILPNSMSFQTTAWIDPVSYFVVRTETVTIGRTITVSYSPPKVNRPIPASRFHQ